jgi:hypothetical protein
VYFVPGGTGDDFQGGETLMQRCDTQAAFDTAATWSSFDISTTGAVGFSGAAFDGRYMYLVPGSGLHSSNLANKGFAARYDVRAPFTATTSWSKFDLKGSSVNAPGFTGAVFDGRYVYLVPDLDNRGHPGSVVPRYDTSAAFTATNAWSSFDVAMLGAGGGFAGGAFDGRYVYFVPFNGSTLARYDTMGAFTSSIAWSSFDTSILSEFATGCFGAAFDGRYLYLAPGSPQPAANQPLATRYDTRAPFGAIDSWTSGPVGSVQTPAAFWGAAFDGRYVYFVGRTIADPHEVLSGTIGRYDTRASSSLPRLCSNPAAFDCDPGSFF